MISFKQFLLLEGGNAVIKGHTAQAIDLTRSDRAQAANNIFSSLLKISAEFKDDTGIELWKRNSLKAGHYFSGSTKHFFNQSLPSEELLKYKKSVGDIDLMVPEALREQIIMFLTHHEGETFGSLKLVGSKKSGDQTITVWHSTDLDQYIQIDFEYSEFENGEPTKWSHFSHSSSFEDMQLGIKGAFHKLLMTSLMGHKKKESVLQMKTKQKDLTASLHALSIKGLRKKYEKIGTQVGKPVIRETGSKEWNTNLYDIVKEVFGIEPKEADIQKFWTFKGILELITEHMSKKQATAVLDSFVEKLWGEKSQGLYRGDPIKDQTEKTAAYDYAVKKLGFGIPARKLAQMKNSYYENYK